MAEGIPTAADPTPAAPSGPTSAGPAPASAVAKRRRWAIAGGGTAVAAVAAAALMQVWQGEEGQAVETARPADAVGKASVGETAAPAGRPRYVARVGNTPITYEQVADEAMARYGTEVLDQLINRTTIELACRERGIVITEAEVEQEITTIAQEFGLDRSNWLQMLQAERNITPLQYKRDVIWPMLALKRLAGTEVQISEADVKKAFERDYGPRVKVRAIMMDNFRRMEDVWRKANEAKAEVEKAGGTPDETFAKASAEFGRLAREFSIEPTSKSLDGAVPPIRKHGGQENLETAAFGLRKGEISGIVQLPIAGAERFVVLFCEGQTEPVVKADQMNVVRDDIVAQLKKEKTQEGVATVFKTIKEKTPVHNFLTNESSGGVNPAAATAPADPTVPTGVRPAGATRPAGPPTAGLPQPRN